MRVITIEIRKAISCTKKFCTDWSGGNRKVCEYFDNWNRDPFDCMQFKVDLKKTPRPERCPACKLSERKVKR
jgi:hypothetical protein